LFKSADGTKVILVDVTSTSGISKHAKLHQYTPGAVAGMAEQRKAASYSKLWNLESERAKLFFGIELSGCIGPEAQHIKADGRSLCETECPVLMWPLHSLEGVKSLMTARVQRD
jgi:hypothetical protein